MQMMKSLYFIGFFVSSYLCGGRCSPKLWWRKAVVTLALLLQLISVGEAQKKETPKYRARVVLVSLDVEVLDRQGNSILNLAQEDFVVKENGRKVKTTHFAELSARPVSLAIVLDMSGIPREQLSIAKQFIFRLAHILSPSDEICLLTFDDRDAYLEQDFTKDRVPLLEALRNIDGALGRKGAILNDLFGVTPRAGLAVDIALFRLRTGNNEKKAVLVISNRFKGLGPATVEHIQESGYTLLTLGFSNKANWLITLGGDQITKNALMRQSGGRKFSANAEDISGICKAIAYSLKNHYSLGYPTEVAEGRQKRRSVEVSIPGSKYVIHARRSYIPSP
jgi:hypothetical protein